MQGTDSPCPCKASFPPSAVPADNSSHLPVKRPRLGDPVSGFLYVPALTVGTPSFIHPPCRSRKKTGTEQDLPCRGHLRQHAAAAVETTEIFPAHYGLFLAALI